VFAGLDEVHLAASLLLPAAQNMKRECRGACPMQIPFSHSSREYLD
jgi:hypothetical protein